MEPTRASEVEVLYL